MKNGRTLLHGDRAIVTERLVLRAPAASDIPAITRLADNLKVSAMTARIPHPYSEADARTFIAWARHGNAHAIVRREDGVLMGCVGVEGETSPELGYWIGEPYWGRGYATEAAVAMLAEAFENPDVEAVVASCRTVNAGSRGVLAKCGFACVGPGEMRSRALGGAMVPTERYRLDRAHWLIATAARERRAARAGVEA